MFQKKGVGTRRLKHRISRGFAARDGSAVKSHSTILQRLRRQISLDYYTIPPATQASHVHAFHMVSLKFRKYYGLYPSHDALQVPTLLGVVSSVCTPLSTVTQQLPTLSGR